MVFPALLGVVSPVIIGILLGVNGVAGMLAGATVTGFILAVMMANAGGAWDNSKNILKADDTGARAAMLIRRQ